MSIIGDEVLKTGSMIVMKDHHSLWLLHHHFVEFIPLTL